MTLVREDIAKNVLEVMNQGAEPEDLITLNKARRILDDVLEVVKASIVEQKCLNLRSFGKFTVVRRYNKQGWKNPKNKELSAKKSITNVKWKRSKKLDQTSL
jgi:nucleoid DNA-binding protein